MRIDLREGGSRPLLARLGLRLAGALVGEVPGPLVAISYRMDLFPRDYLGYLSRATSDSSAAGGWTRGEKELFASFVSSLNACHF